MCSKCPKKNSCVQICRKVERLLPDPDAGKIHFSSRDAQDVLKTIALARVLAAALASNRGALSGKKRRVFDLRMNDALPLSAIGKKLGINERTAAYHLYTGYEIVLRRAKARAFAG